MLIEFHLPLLLPLLGRWQRMHWQQRRRCMKTLAEHVAVAVHGRKPSPPLARCRISVVRLTRSGEPDHENLVGSLKPLLDVLCAPGRVDAKGHALHPWGLSIIADDSPAVIGRPEITVGRPGEWPPGTHVTIEAVQ